MRPIILVVLLATLTGCPVPKKKFDALQAELDKAKATCEQDLAAKDQQFSDLHAKLKGVEEQLATAQGDLAKETEARTAAEARISLLEKEKAQILADKGALKGEVSKMQAAMADLEARRAKAEAAVRSYKDLVARFKKLIDAGTLEVKIIDGRMVVAMKTDVLFESGSADLSEAGKTALTEVGQVLATIPDRRFQVEGNTDNVPIKTSKYPDNWYLAAGRAINVTQHLVASGGMKPEVLSAASYGEFHPSAANDTPENKAKNRRIEIVVVPDLADLPGYDELQQATKAN